MKFSKFSGVCLLVAFLGAFTACEDDNSTIGSVIAGGEVNISVTDLEYQLEAHAVELKSFDSKTGSFLLGNLQNEIYGKLNCSFVTRLMCSANLGIPDSIFNLPDFIQRVDSCKLILSAQRSDVVGDSLAPQIMSVYRLIKALPSDINNTFDPSGYYDPSEVMASRSYTVSGIAEKDSAFYSNDYVDITVDLPVSFGRDIFYEYKNNPEYFQWPQTMAEKFLQGLYVAPTFGNGCVANINALYVAVYYYTLKTVTTEDENGGTTVSVKHVANSVLPFTVSPEVLSSNNVTYQPSDRIKEKNEKQENGEIVITTPGGYVGQFVFPARDLLDRYNQNNVHLSTLNDLNLYIPAEPYDEESGLGVTKHLLLIKTSEYEDFFNNNKVPDNLSSFTGVYDSKNKRYAFSSMRNYFLNLLRLENLEEDDVNFTLIPVEIQTESSGGYYGETSYVVKCVPYTAKPTMTLLKTNEAVISFSYSTQLLE